METYVKKLPLQTIREINGHSISDLSKSIGMSHSAIYDIENRNKKPRIGTKHTSNYNDNRIIDVNVSASYYQLFKKLLEWKYRNDFQYPNIDTIRLDWLQFKQIFKEWENNWIEE